jgi:hypothetical protein
LREYLPEHLGHPAVSFVDSTAPTLAIPRNPEVVYITLHQGDDKAMPSRRIGMIWKAMYKSREVSRPHCVKRVAAIRNHLSDLGLIAWEDDRYWSPDKAGKLGCETRKGVCCKYSLSPELMERLGLVVREMGLPGYLPVSALSLSMPFPSPRRSTAGTSLETIPFDTELPARTRHNTSNDPDVFTLLGLERPVIRPTRVGWASEYWGREAA